MTVSLGVNAHRVLLETIWPSVFVKGTKQPSVSNTLLIQSVLPFVAGQTVFFSSAMPKLSKEGIIMLTQTKKTLAALLAILMALGLFLTGCADSSSEETASASPSQEVESSASAESSDAVEEESTESAEPVEIIIAAAASLTIPLTEVADNYMAEYSNVTVTLDFASSGKLQTQIENGAPADIFFSAATSKMEALEEQSLIEDGSRVDILRNEIVLIVPVDSDLGLTSFEDAAADIVTSIAVGDPDSVPAGQYAKQTFTYLNLWDAISAKAVLGSDVKQVLSWVSTAEAECGIVYQTDAYSDEGVTIVAMAPDESHNAVVYPVAIVEYSEKQEAAAAFIEYLQTADAMSVFEASGFLAY